MAAPATVHPLQPRFAQAITGALCLEGAIFQTEAAVVVALLLVVMNLAGPRWSPVAWVFRYIAPPARELEPSAPPRFAQAMAAVLLAVPLHGAVLEAALLAALPQRAVLLQKAVLEEVPAAVEAAVWEVLLAAVWEVLLEAGQAVGPAEDLLAVPREVLLVVLLLKAARGPSQVEVAAAKTRLP